MHRIHFGLDPYIMNEMPCSTIIPESKIKYTKEYGYFGVSLCPWDEK